MGNRHRGEPKFRANRAPRPDAWPPDHVQFKPDTSALPSERWFEMTILRHNLVPPVEAPEAQVPFESALEKLESIVESMESGDVPLAELLAKFEEGNRLLKICEARLKDAELKIEQLKKQKDGSVTFEKFGLEREV